MQFTKARSGARWYSTALATAALAACTPATPVQPAGGLPPAASAPAAGTAVQPGGAAAPAGSAAATVISGRVTEQDAALAGVEVKVLRMGSRETLGSVRTDADGQYSFTAPAGLQAGAMVQVLVTSDAHRLTSAAQVGGLVAAGAGNLVAAGAGNLVAAGAGNLVAAGAGNYALQDVTQVDVTRETTYAVAAFFEKLVAADRAMAGRDERDPEARQQAASIVGQAFDAFNRLAATIQGPPTGEGEGDAFVGTIFNADGTPGELQGDGDLGKFIEDLKEKARELGIGLVIPDEPEGPPPAAPQGTVTDTTDSSSGGSGGASEEKTRTINVYVDAPVEGTFGLLTKASTVAHRWVAADVFEYRLLVDCDASADHTFVLAQKGDAIVGSATFTVTRTEAEPVLTLQAWGNQGGTAATAQLNAAAPTVFQPTPAGEDVGERTIRLSAQLDATAFIGGIAVPIASPTGGGFSNPSGPVATSAPGDVN